MVNDLISMSITSPKGAYPTRTSSIHDWCSKLIPPLPEDGSQLNHESTSHAPATVEAIKLIPPGQKLSKYIPGYGSNYRRLAQDRPSWTVTATCYTDLIHPVENRLLTVRELARLQTFPDRWWFAGPRRGGAGNRLVAHVFAQIGNAVPPLLAYSLAEHLKSKTFSDKQSISTISLFSGAGGMDIGFEAAGFDIRACVEKDRYAASTLRLNRTFGRKKNRHTFLRNAVILQTDIFDLSTERLLRASRLNQDAVDLIIGGPPCQSFSHAGTREGKADHRGLLVDEFLRVVRDLSPKCVVFENVPGLRSAEDGAVLTYLESQLSELGFNVEQILLNAADYGVPQIRKRLFVIAHRNSTIVGKPRTSHSGDNVPLLSSLFEPHRTVADALRSLPQATPPGRVADAIAKTIAARKSKQDFTKLLKRSMRLSNSARHALQPYYHLLSHRQSEIERDYGAILLYTLQTRKTALTAAEALRLFADEFGLRFPEKAQGAAYIFGARPLAANGLVNPVCNAQERLHLTISTPTNGIGKSSDLLNIRSHDDGCATTGIGDDQADSRRRPGREEVHN